MPARLVQFFFVLLYLVVLPAQLAADVTIDTSFSYYDITGHSTSELRESIYANSKIDRATGGFDASTNWSISVQFEYLDGPQGCQMTNAEVITKIEYRLPRCHSCKNNANPDLTSKWRKYINQLTDHELQHGTITSKAAKAIEQTILNLHNNYPNSACAAFETKANATIDKLITELRRQHSDFDLRTDHGVINGAVLP